MRKYLRHIVSRILYIAPGFSELDTEKSRPEEGVFVWKKKRVISYRDDMVRPEHKLKFQRNAPLNISALLASGWEFVTLSDPYVPEGAILNAEKHWTFMDAILMKCRLEDYLESREDALQRSETAGAARKAKFAAEARKEGAVALTDAEMGEMAEKERKVREQQVADRRRIEKQSRLIGR